MNSDTNPKDLPPSEPRYAPNVPATLEITNLTVKDLGDTVEASYVLTSPSVTAHLNRQPIPKSDLLSFMKNSYMSKYTIFYFLKHDIYLQRNIHAVVESYLKQNLK